jgi:signal transduction histidine kinase
LSDRPGLDDALASAAQFNRDFGIYLYDPSGRPISAMNKIDADPLAPEVLRDVLSGARRGGYGYLAGNYVYSYFVPLQEQDNNIGVLRVTRLTSDFHDYIARVRWQGVSWWIAAVAIMTALVLFGHHIAIGAPLGRLVASIAAVTAGDRNHRTPADGPREITALGLALNRMLDSISEAQREIERRHRIQTDLERRLRHSEAMAALGRLAGGVAHELGTPLSTVDGKAQRLLRREDGGGPVAEALQEIRHEVRRMEQIVRQLLDFGRHQGDQRRLLAADQLAEMAQAAVSQRFAESATTLTLEGPRPGLRLLVNPLRVEQALVNLLKNAEQANPGGRVRLSWFADDASAGGGGFRVEDAGPGIADELKQRVFEPFYTTKDVGQGSGLGLAVVESVAREHGGSVEVATSGLGGAGFVLHLPGIAPDELETTAAGENE